MISDETAKTIQEMKDDGLIAWTGEFRQDADGVLRKTYAITPKGIIALALLQNEADDA